jgi:hypothetical protein
VPLSIPRQHRAPLKRLYELTADDPRPLIELLESLPEFTPTPELRSRIEELWPRLTPREARDVVLALVSLAAQRDRWQADELGRRVSESPDLSIPDNGRERFGALISQLVEIKVLATTAKALAVMMRQEHVYRDARIMTDVRPIFGDDPAIRPSGAVILHTLSLEHYTSGRRETLNVSMEAGDLRALKSAVDRATRKAKSLTDVVESSGLSLFEFQEADVEDD